MIGSGKHISKTAGRDSMKAAGYLVFGEPQSDGSEMINIEQHLNQNNYGNNNSYYADYMSNLSNH